MTPSKCESLCSSSGHPLWAPGPSEHKPVLPGEPGSRARAAATPGSCVPGLFCGFSCLHPPHALGTLAPRFPCTCQTHPCPRGPALPVPSACSSPRYLHGLLSPLPRVSGATFAVWPSLTALSECVSYPSTPCPLSVCYFFAVGPLTFRCSVHGIDLPGLLPASPIELLWAGVYLFCSQLHS